MNVQCSNENSQNEIQTTVRYCYTLTRMGKNFKDGQPQLLARM